MNMTPTGNAAADHATAAAAIITLYQNQLQNAEDLGEAAWTMGLRFIANPFRSPGLEELSNRWNRGMNMAKRTDEAGIKTEEI